MLNRWNLKPIVVTVLAAACFAVSACRSAFIQTAIVNHSGSPVRLLEIDYPSASFGTQQIAADGVYRYHFKVQDSGPVKMTFTNSAGKTITLTGPTLHEGQQGNLTITIQSDDTVTFAPVLSYSR
jgi:VCBS repeat-containing protein